MTVAKVWNGLDWESITPLDGRQGPQGPQGFGAPPSGPAGGDLAGNYPSPTVKNRIVTGGLLAVQRVVGSNNAYRAITNGSNLTTNAAGTTALAVNYTPTVDCWWEVTAHVGIFQKLETGYSYANIYFVIVPADVDGRGVGARYANESGNATVQTYNYRAITQVFKLAASTAYSCVVRAGIAAGTWQFHQGPAYLGIEGRAWAR